MEILLYGLVAFGLVLVAYKFSPAKVLPTAKPAFAFLPKYQIQVQRANNSVDQITRALEALDFVRGTHGGGKQRYVRGHTLGDFSIKIAKVHVDIPSTSIGAPTLDVSYGSFALFDTGDLWEFCSELRDKLKQGA